MQLLIIGGDQRMKCLALLARANGHGVQLIGHDEKPLCEIKPCACVVFPFPIAVKDSFVPCPFGEAPFPLASVLPLIQKGAVVFATKPDAALLHYIQKHGCTHIDLQNNEAFAMRNAVPSAEGAILSLLNKSNACLSGSACLVIGYGRIGRALSLRLRGIGASVTVAARSETARAAAENDGCRAIPMELLRKAHAHRYVINTVPFLVMGYDELAALPAACLVVDLSSAPYGVDIEAASQLGICAWREPGLPGRCFPETAAQAMLDAIEEEWSVTK